MVISLTSPWWNFSFTMVFFQKALRIFQYAAKISFRHEGGFLTEGRVTSFCSAYCGLRVGTETTFHVRK